MELIVSLKQSLHVIMNYMYSVVLLSVEVQHYDLVYI